MTKTTEELKRDVYEKLADFRKIISIGGFTPAEFIHMENSLEAYLEAMRQEAIAKDVRIDHLERMGDVMRDGYMYQQQLTAQARTEADRERNRCQAFEFANKSAGEFLAEARAKLKAQRQHFGKLKNERDNYARTVKVRTSQRDGLEAQLLEARRELSELRKSLPGTSAQSHGANVHKSICGGLAIGSHAECVHPFRNVRWSAGENGRKGFKCGLCGEEAK